jgi:ubiquinone/menaquinone biosynthesis C-methylase UbiE
LKHAEQSTAEMAPAVQPVAATGPNADPRFVEYYEAQSLSENTIARFASVKRQAISVRERLGLPTSNLQVVDVGCGPGAQSIIWAADGHHVRGIDISAPLIEIARRRSKEAGVDVEYSVGSATSLPYPDASCDVALVPELLEHVSDWRSCLKDAVRILKPGGLAYFCTTNRLCPVQQEFDLPLYSWYPASLKRRCEAMALTSHKHWVSYTSFPAVNWFSFYQLRAELAASGIRSFDRFDVIEAQRSALRRTIVATIRASSLLRFAGQLLTPYTVVFGVKQEPR